MKKSTKFAHLGRPKIGKGTGVNPPIVRASTLAFEKAGDLYSTKQRSYGRHGSALHDSLREMFCELENGAGCMLVPSGLAADTIALQAIANSGDHILVTDSCYGPVKYFCENYLSRFDIETEYFPPDIGSGIADFIKPNTTVIFSESPGSLSLEIQDLPAIVAVAKKHDITVIVDNTWSAGLVYAPLDLGADIVTHSATKYYSGHGDVLFGAIVSRTDELADKVRLTGIALGNATSPDDAYQILRGFRTITTRFNQQAESALALAKWLETRPEVKTMIHPALTSHPQHDVWKRDFTGSGCLFSFVLNPCKKSEVLAFLDRLKYLAKGFSFGGYESVIIHCDPQLKRKQTKDHGGPLIRLGCGLEDIEDLKSDLTDSLEKIKFNEQAS